MAAWDVRTIKLPGGMSAGRLYRDADIIAVLAALESQVTAMVGPVPGGLGVMESDVVQESQLTTMVAPVPHGPGGLTHL